MKSYSFFSQSSSEDLSETEKGVLNYIELAIDTNDQKMLDKVKNSVIKYASDRILRLCSISNKFNNYCQTDNEFHKAIANEQKQFNFISIEVHSMDKQEYLNFFYILLATNYYSEYFKPDHPLSQDTGESKAKRSQALNKACEIGLYNALINRCKENALEWGKIETTAEEKLKIEEVIWKDINRLTNLYWGIGYIQAGGLLCKFGNSLVEIKDELDRGLTMYEQGIKRILCASFLEDHSYSKEIEKCVTHGKGYFLNDYDPKCRNWDDLKGQLRQWSGSDANYERLYNLAKLEIEKLLQNNQNESKLSL